MADIELVIKIPEELYKKWSCSHPANNTYPEWYIMHGIPLPKGHGRLIDADVLRDRFNFPDWGRVVQEHYIDSAPTVIEADKGEQE